MAWRYTFDGGPEREMPDVTYSAYALAAMVAFSQEKIVRLPTVNVPGVEPYDGHVLQLWEPKLREAGYGPYAYGIGLNQCGGLTVLAINVRN